MSSQNYDEIQKDLEQFEIELNKINPRDDIFKSKRAINDLEDLVKKLNGQFLEIKNEKEKMKNSNYEPLMDEFDENYNKFRELKRKYYKMIDEVSTNYEQKALFDDYQKESAQRNMAVGQIEELKEQGKMLDAIYQNIKESLHNILAMKTELQRQDEQLERIDKKVIDIIDVVDDTEKNFVKIEKRLYYRIILLYIGIVILFLFNLLMLYFTIAKGVGLPPFKKSEVTQTSNILKVPLSYEPKEISGINYNLVEDIDLNEFENKGLSFIVLKAEEDTSIQEKIITFIDKAKEKNIKVALYWYLKQNEEINALEEANKAINFLKELNEKGKELQLGFYYKFDKENNLQTNYNIINKLCEKIEYDCGVALTYSNFKTNYKDNLDSITKIKNYWVNSEGESIDDSFKNLITIWNSQESIAIKDLTYYIIKSLEKNK